MATDKPQVLVRFDRVYGKIACYPVNPAAMTITALTGKKTLSLQDLECAKSLGFEIAIEAGSAAVMNEFFNKDVLARCAAELSSFIDPTGALRAAGLLYVERPA